MWDSRRQTVLVNFTGNAARPTLQDGEWYLLVVERDDGGELNLILRVGAAAPLIVVVR